MDDPVSRVPNTNLLAYSLLYHIETALRELIIEEMERCCGPKWWRQRVPGDVVISMREGREAERSIPWLRMVSHHPIYYTYFSHLKQIITRSDNWRDVFIDIFVHKDRLEVTLTELEQVRNKIAHNRKVSEVERDVVRAAYAKLSSMIGDKRFIDLASRCASLTDVPSVLRQLGDEACVCTSVCASCEPLPDTCVWGTAKQSWWFDEHYLGGPIDSVAELFILFDEYRDLPRVRGSGYIIEQWLESRRLSEVCEAATDQLEALIRESR